MIKPLFENVVIVPVKQEQKTKGGIFIPETAQDNSQKGQIVEISEFIKNENLQSLKKGDNVLYKKYSGSEIEIDGQKYIVIEIKDILAKL